MSTIVKNTLKVEIGTWSDPGDYPNSLASGPLPDRKYIEEVLGEIQIQVAAEDVDEVRGFITSKDIVAIEDWIDCLPIELPKGVEGIKWSTSMENDIVTLTVDEFESDPYYFEE